MIPAISPQLATLYAFVAWALSWLAAAPWSDRAARRVGFAREWFYRIVTIIGTVMVFADRRVWPGGPALWHTPQDVQWLLFVVAIAGIAFTWWARLHLGRLWSGTVTRKTDHHVVDTGPYAIVRHPIYTGMIAAAAAFACETGTLLAVAGVAVFVWGFVIKARLEESFLRSELGPEAYDSYRRRVPMLLPFGPKSA